MTLLAIVVSMLLGTLGVAMLLVALGAAFLARALRRAVLRSLVSSTLNQVLREATNATGMRKHAVGRTTCHCTVLHVLIDVMTRLAKVKVMRILHGAVMPLLPASGQHPQLKQECKKSVERTCRAHHKPFQGIQEASSS